MFFAAHEWTAPSQCLRRPASPHSLALAPQEGNARPLYQRLAHTCSVRDDVQAEARAFLVSALQQAEGDECELPDSPHDLAGWMHNTAQLATANYRAYLEARKAGGPRRYFQNRAHALYFLRSVAPTKLVDGAWLHGLLADWQDARFSHLITTYVEELGEGQPDKNHVLLYRQLLARHGLDSPGPDDLPDDYYTQGAVQLALGVNTAEFLPEVIGFNLGYEQLPLHLLITACELNELGIDPYYFTLHITVDNADTGHAQRAVQSLQAALPQLDHGQASDFWRRVRNGSKLANAGIGTTEAIAGFDLEREVHQVLARKSVTGHGAHSDHCRVAGRSVNDWLAQPEGMPGFVAALQQAGWIRRGAPSQESRFWKLLQGEKAEMFGVFSPYELQLIHDWMRGDASADGQAFNEPAIPAGQRRLAFRVAERRTPQPIPAQDAPDADLVTLQARLAGATGTAQKIQHLIPALSPALHWTPVGLYATRAFQALTA